MDITVEKYYDDNLENYNLLNKIDPMTAKQAMEIMEEYHQAKLKLLGIGGVVVELPSKNSKEFKGWLKSEGYKNKGFGIYQKENKDYCYTILYKHYCNVLEFGN